MSLVAAFLDLFAPRRCLGCHRTLAATAPPLCARCGPALPWWRRADGCPRCGHRMPLDDAPEPGLFVRPADGCPGCLVDGSPLHACQAVLRYAGPARIWIPAFKRRTGPFGPALEATRAVEFLTAELARRSQRARWSAPDALVPIPLHPRRRRERGFNHADAIARPLGRALERPVRPTLLRRIRATRPQASLHGRERRENVRGAFRASPRGVAGQRIWLVDDVLTTGHTLEAAAECLLEAGAEEVQALTLAATLPPRRRVDRRPGMDPGDRCSGFAHERREHR